MNIKEEKKGISLIVLVITIIVIIILAVAVILSIANNNPIENAKKAKEDHNKAELKEAANIEYSYYYTENKLKNEDIDINLIRENLVKKGFTQEDVNMVQVLDYGIDLVKYPPIVPNGFKYLTGTVETGYVIKNIVDGNEFVWIPVDDINEFQREDGYYKGNKQSYLKTTSEPYKNATQAELNEYDEMKKSVEYYHGFYIARYESSQGEDGKAYSIKNKKPWINIFWGKSVTDLTGGAVEEARKVYSSNREGIKEKDPVSTLCYGVEWDQTVRFIEKNYPGILVDSSGKGNYEASKIINTGSNDQYAQNNIYDMAGNVLEWTMEANETYSRVIRGGNHAYTGLVHPISLRDYVTPGAVAGASGEVGFRIALYIK